MSFIDLMASDVWSEADIIRRTEAMVRQYFSADAEMIINRKLQGAALGQYALSAEEMAEIARFNEVVSEARAAGDAARADMALLAQVMAHEAAMREAKVAHDAAVERNAALAEGEAPEPVPDLLPAPVEGDPIFALWSARNPPEPEPEVEPELMA